MVEVKQVEWFKNKILKNKSGCWEYQKGKEQNGYCRIMVNYKRYGAHRYSWINSFGKIPKGLWVLHKCDNPCCINPKHLFLGNASDNGIDCVLKGRNPNTKLNVRKIRIIRKRISSGDGVRALGRKFGVCHKTIYEIKNGIRWAHVK